MRKLRAYTLQELQADHAGQRQSQLTDRPLCGAVVYFTNHDQLSDLCTTTSFINVGGDNWVEVRSDRRKSKRMQAVRAIR